MTGLRTACHGCRGQVVDVVQDTDGVHRSRLVPVAGDGTVTRAVMAVGGEALIPERCRVCNGTGWLPGFQPPG